MAEPEHAQPRHAFRTFGLALVASVILASLVGGGAFFWSELDQAKRDNAALAAQVRSLGGKPVADGKPGARGDQGPQGPPGPQGVQGSPGPPGIQGPRGPIGITGQSPACLLEPSRCVGPKGANGSNGVNGKPGADGTQGPQGPAGVKGDQGVPGAAGKDGADGKPGADGAAGADGKDGRGVSSIICQPDGSWLINYTDDTTSTTDGPCRVVTPSLKATN